MKKIKRFVKELKRVRWPSAEVAGKSFLKSTIFIAVSALVIFGITIGFAMLWSTMGVGL